MVIEKGTEIMRCEPFVTALQHDLHPEFCDFCLSHQNELKDTTLKRCSGCKFIYFCGTECLKKAWKDYHKAECEYMMKLTGPVPDGAREGGCGWVPQDNTR